MGSKILAKIAGFVLLVAMGTAHAAGAERGACQNVGPASSAASQIRSIQQRLSAAMPQGMASMGGDVPSTAQHDIAALKDALASATDALLACAPVSKVNAPRVQRSLDLALGGAPSPSPSGFQYTNLSTVQVRKVSGDPPWLLVRLGIPTESCGNDNMLLVYAPGAGGWRRIARLQSKPYAKISGAWGDFFDAVVLRAKDDRNRRIVIAHGTPWCTSRWSSFHVGVYELGSVPDSAREVFSVTRGYSRGYGALPLRVVPGGFGLQLQQCVDGDPDLCYRSVFTWRASGDTWVREQPVALTPRGFVAAWFNTHWSEAERWTAKATRSRLQHVHAGTNFVWQHGFMRLARAVHCAGSQYQVELRHGPRATGKAIRYFRVRADRDHRFTLLGSGAAPLPGCAVASGKAKA